jgi:hypothetical protein
MSRPKTPLYSTSKDVTKNSCVYTQFPNFNSISWVPILLNFVPVIPLAARSVGLTFARLTPGFSRLKLAPESIKNLWDSPSICTSRSSSFQEAPTTRSWGRLRGSGRRSVTVWGCGDYAILHKLEALILMVTQLFAMEAMNLFSAGVSPSGGISRR